MTLNTTWFVCFVCSTHSVNNAAIKSAEEPRCTQVVKREAEREHVLTPSHKAAQPQTVERVLVPLLCQSKHGEI